MTASRFSLTSSSCALAFDMGAMLARTQNGRLQDAHVMRTSFWLYRFPDTCSTSVAFSCFPSCLPCLRVRFMTDPCSRVSQNGGSDASPNATNELGVQGRRGAGPGSRARRRRRWAARVWRRRQDQAVRAGNSYRPRPGCRRWGSAETCHPRVRRNSFRRPERRWIGEMNGCDLVIFSSWQELSSSMVLRRYVVYCRSSLNTFRLGYRVMLEHDDMLYFSREIPTTALGKVD